MSEFFLYTRLKCHKGPYKTEVRIAAFSAVLAEISAVLVENSAVLVEFRERSLQNLVNG